MRFRASDVANAAGGRLVGGDVDLDGVSFDSRSISAGQLFVPLIDQRDGHDFIDAAIVRGARAFFTSRGSTTDVTVAGATAIVVPDTLEALMALATARRRLSAATVIGITGSVGKTSTKDFAWAALAPSRRTWANERSFNNDQGLPTTILNAPDDTEVMVLEMGMRGFGEIRRLCSIAAPSIGVVTRVAEAHSDRVGGIDGVAVAKAELIESLPSAGTAILNGDDARVRSMATRCAGAVVFFGESDDCDIRLRGIELDDLARASFELCTPSGNVMVRLGVSGRHMAANAAAALACVAVVGGDLHAAAAALAGVRLTPMRMDVTRSTSGAIVLDDSYNANPTSMRAALDALTELPVRRRTAVLGVMAEISEAPEEHLAVAAYANERNVRVIAWQTHLYGTAPVDDVLSAIGDLGPDDGVLIKGSRVAALEGVAAQVRAR
jgi:UDP-N-acetylmuramoyl-tripeptide--D-alanyl-D-alanine ligase